MIAKSGVFENRRVERIPGMCPRSVSIVVLSRDQRNRRMPEEVIDGKHQSPLVFLQEPHRVAVLFPNAARRDEIRQVQVRPSLKVGELSLTCQSRIVRLDCFMNATQCQQGRRSINVRLSVIEVVL